MKLRYGLLVGAAFNRTIVKFSLTAIGSLWAEAEGEPISAASVTAYLGKMVEAGLITRYRRGRFDWITELHKLYKPNTTTNNQTQDNDLTPTPGSGSNSLTPTPNRSQNRLTPTPASRSLVTSADDVVDFDHIYNDMDQQQQQLVDRLERFNIATATAMGLAQAGISERDVILWITYTKTQKSIRNPTGFVISKLNRREPPPRNGGRLICPICSTFPCRCEEEQ